MFRKWLLMTWAQDGGAGAGGAAAAAPALGGDPAAAAAAAAAPFADSLPQDLREDAVFKDIKNLDGLARSYVSAAKMVGMDKGRIVALPADDDAAGWNDVFTKLGRPEAPDKYGFKAPEGVQVDTKLQEAFAAKAHEAGLSAKQAAALYDWYNGASAEARTAMETQGKATSEAGIAALKTEWGAAFDQNVGLATKAVEHYGNPQLRAELEKTGLGNNPELVKTFAKLGRQLSEDGLIGKGGEGGGGDSINSPTEARQAIAAKKGDAAFMKGYLDPKSPNHSANVAEMQRLYDQAYPEPAKA